MLKSFNETARLQSERRSKRIKEVRGERLHGTVDSWISAARLANSSAVSLPRRNE